jgi:hypothetical protein
MAAPQLSLLGKFCITLEKIFILVKEQETELSVKIRAAEDQYNFAKKINPRLVTKKVELLLDPYIEQIMTTNVIYFTSLDIDNTDAPEEFKPLLKQFRYIWLNSLAEQTKERLWRLVHLLLIQCILLSGNQQKLDIINKHRKEPLKFEDHK